MDWGKSIRLSRATGVERVVATDINPFKLERAGEVFRMMVGGKRR
jgi:threonine dehydrogenase-like Zn-dependent dehydrogenase